MMLRYMMFTYDITYEVWYMISHVNLAEDHIRFSHEMPKRDSRIGAVFSVQCKSSGLRRISIHDWVWIDKSQVEW